jgi:polysaccharide export outer membrane protein
MATAPHAHLRGRLFRSAILVLALLLGPRAAPAQQAAQPDYVVGPQDVLSITVWDQNDLSGKFTVEADGTFTFPLIGRIQAGSLTLRQIEAELKKQLADGYFKDPQLTVSIDTYRSQKVFIVGEVRAPGTYNLTGDMSLIEALSRAGSTTPNASIEVLIVRAPAGKAATGPAIPTEADVQNAIRVDLKELQSGAVHKNVALRDGDTIFVPKAETVYVSGQVKNPGAYALQTRDTTVLQAVSLAGGVTDRGSTGRIRILRVVKGRKVEIKAKLDDVVQPGDTILVPERFF